MAAGAALSLKPGSSLMALAVVAGSTLVVLALAVYSTHQNVGDIIDWAQRVFGPAFILIYSLLISISLRGWIRAKSLRGSPQSAAVDLEIGLQAAAGVATLALTFTLLGISLGIGGLADTPLNPETVNTVIAGLCRHFATAFMTSVVGLPTAAVLRALLHIEQSKQLTGENTQ